MQKSSDNDISLYVGELSEETIIKATDKILMAFPKMDRTKLKLLRQRFRENGFTDQRVIDSVNNVIDTYEGWDKLPNIANFIQFDKKVRTYIHSESIELGQENLTMVDIGLDKPRWVLKEDQIKYKLKKWSK